MERKSKKSGGVRFAPSPTGRFHLGNLRTAWVSARFAASFGLPWVVRFEDIDQPRVVPGARDRQVEDLSSLGLRPDLIQLQSLFHSRHLQLFEKGVREGKIYPCFCSRKEVQTALERSASAPHGATPSYSGKCRSSRLIGAERLPSTLAWRFRADDPGGADDLIVARTTPRPENPAEPDSASFVPSYHWACAIDDFDGAFDLLVRAWDLSSATRLQRMIQSWLADAEGVSFRFPAVFHTSLVVQEDGHRLEKRTRGVTLDELLLEGWTVSGLLERFATSLNPEFLTRKPAPGSELGEVRQNLKLSELLGT